MREKEKYYHFQHYYTRKKLQYEKNLSRICFKLCTEPPIMTIFKPNTFLINIFQNLINDFLCSSLKLNNIFQQQIKRNQLSLFIILGKTGRFT